MSMSTMLWRGRADIRVVGGHASRAHFPSTRNSPNAERNFILSRRNSKVVPGNFFVAAVGLHVLVDACMMGKRFNRKTLAPMWATRRDVPGAPGGAVHAGVTSLRPMLWKPTDDGPGASVTDAILWARRVSSATPDWRSEHTGVSCVRIPCPFYAEVVLKGFSNTGKSRVG